MSSQVSVPSSESPQSDAAPVATARPGRAPRGHWLLWAFLVLLVTGIVGAAALQNARRNGREPLPDPVKAAPAFALTDANGKSFSSEQLAGKPYVIDFIFTRCGGQCPLMTVQMRDLQRWMEERGYDINLVTVSVDPDTDTPEVLTEYAKRFKVDDKKNWAFLTGPRETVYPMIKTGFLLGVDENKGVPAEEEFIHSDRFVLVDAEGQIRGFYPATDDEQMKKLRRVIWTLMADKDK